MQITYGKVDYKPEDVGYNSERLDVLNTHFERLMNEKLIQSAAYCLSRDGKVFTHNAIGKHSFKEDDSRLLQPDVMRGVASITKIFCSTAIFKLCEDGFIRLNQPVHTILQEMNESPFNEITIAHLLSHTSGLQPDHGCFPHEYSQPWAYIDQLQKSGENTSWVKASMKAGMFTKPGKEWAYCSFGFVLLGEIIHRVTGIRAEEYIHKTILDPLEMTDSYFENEFYLRTASNDSAKKLCERLYVQNEDDLQIVEALKSYKQGDTSTASEEDLFWANIPCTGGGLISTTADLNKFGRMLINDGYSDSGKRIIGRKAIERMTENYTLPEIKDNCWGAGGVYRMYGLGPDTRRNADSHYSKDSFFHEGAGACCLLMDPKERMVASWFVPFADYDWHPEALYNASAVMWSGLK